MAKFKSINEEDVETLFETAEDLYGLLHGGGNETEIVFYGKMCITRLLEQLNSTQKQFDEL